MSKPAGGLASVFEQMIRDKLAGQMILKITIAATDEAARACVVLENFRARYFDYRRGVFLEETPR
jgi:hypothetical protein